MATLTQLQAEPWWGREIVTPELDWLADEISSRLRIPRSWIGTKGNAAHLRGGHRSQEWLLNSRYCTDRKYTVQSGLTGEQPRHIAAIDVKPGEWGSAANRAAVAAQTRGLVAAAQAGRLGGVARVIGTMDGKTPVGLNVITRMWFAADSTHLDHWHADLDRRRMRDRSTMERILVAALGIELEGSLLMFCKHGDKGPQVWVLQRQLNEAGVGPVAEDWRYGDQTAASLVRAGVVGGDTTGRTYGPGELAGLAKVLRERAAREAVEAHQREHPVSGAGLAPGDRLTLDVVSTERG